jgi:DNA gyrase/topoisomerase IV subunit B
MSIKVYSFENDVRKNLHKYMDETGESNLTFMSLKNGSLVEQSVVVPQVELYSSVVEFLDNAFDNASSFVRITQKTQIIEITNDIKDLMCRGSYNIRDKMYNCDTLELITQNQFSSSNFEKKDYKKGMFGIGLKIAFLVLTDVHIVLTDSQRSSRMIVSGSQKSVDYDGRYGIMEPNTFSVFVPDMPYLFEFIRSKAHIYNIDLAFMRRKIGLSVNGEIIRASPNMLSQIAEVKLKTSSLTMFTCNLTEGEIMTVFAGESTNSVLFVNGKEVRSGTWTTKLRSLIAQELKCQTSQIRAKIGFCCHVNIRDAKFNANSKTNLANIKSITLAGTLDKPFLNAIMKPSLDKKKSNLINKVELKGFSRARNSTNLNLYIVEGLSAESTFRNSIDRTNSAIFCTQGKVLNCLRNKCQIEENETLLQLAKILGIKNFEIERYAGPYNSIIIACDPDPDGFHIVGLMINLFKSVWPCLLSRLRILSFPLYKTSVGYSYNKVHDVTKYYKGLGSFEIAEMKILMRDRSYLKTLTFSPETKEIECFFGTDSAYRFSMLQHKPKQLEDVLVKSDLIENDIISLLHLYSEEVCDRSIPDLSGFTRAERQAIYGSLGKQGKLTTVVGMIIAKSGYQHAPDNMIGVVMKLGRTYVGSNNITIMNIIGANGSRLKPKDYASARYLSVGKSKLNVFSSTLHEAFGFNTDEGKQTTPKMLTLYPFLFINGNYGIGCGIKTFIPCHDKQQVIDYLTGQSDRIPEIKYRGFTGIIEVDDVNNKFTSVGLYKQMSFTNGVLHVVVYEIPLMIFVDKFIERIPSKLTQKDLKIDTDEEASASTTINVDSIEISDFSTYEKIEIHVKVHTNDLASTLKKIDSMMQLVHHMSLRIYHEKVLYLFKDRREMFSFYKTMIHDYSSKYLEWTIRQKQAHVDLLLMKRQIVRELICININTLHDVNAYLTTKIPTYNSGIFESMKAPDISLKYLTQIEALIELAKREVEDLRKHNSATFYTEILMRSN